MVAVVQSVATIGGGGGAAGTWTGTFGSGVTTGSTLFFNPYSYDSGATISAGTPKYNGSAYASASQLIGESSAGAGNVFSATWMYPDISSGGGTTVSLACINGNVDGNVGSVAYEVSGLGATPALDRSAGQSHTGSSALVTSGATSAIQFAPEFVLGTAVIYGASPGAPAGFTNAYNIAGGFCVSGYQIPVSSGGTYAYDTGTSGPNDYAATVATVYAPGGTAHNATAALTVTPSFSAARARGKYRTAALTVTPSSSAARVRGKYRTGSLAVPPSFSATRITAHVRTAALTVAPSFSAIPAGGAFAPPVFTYPAYWTVRWVQADTQVTVSPAGAQTATVTSAVLGESAATLYPPGPAVIYPSP
jgi:hypothetical protein